MFLFLLAPLGSFLIASAAVPRAVRRPQALVLLDVAAARHGRPPRADALVDRRADAAERVVPPAHAAGRARALGGKDELGADGRVRWNVLSLLALEVRCVPRAVDAVVDAPKVVGVVAALHLVAVVAEVALGTPRAVPERGPVAVGLARAARARIVALWVGRSLELASPHAVGAVQHALAVPGVVLAGEIGSAAASPRVVIVGACLAVECLVAFDGAEIARARVA